MPEERTSATITPYRNGPYLVRGDFAVVDQDGNEIRRSRETIALCRCGRSQSKPFCDGTHKVVGFSAGSEADPPRPLEPSGS
jgi:CDGSH-type Zn-finger protein